ncbi:MAG TPA: hypothetical protein VGI22_10940 [Xanthobacteraceae bacterium]
MGIHRGDALAAHIDEAAAQLRPDLVRQERARIRQGPGNREMLLEPDLSLHAGLLPTAPMLRDLCPARCTLPGSIEARKPRAAFAQID